MIATPQSQTGQSHIGQSHIDTEHLDVLIVGAGISGIGAAYYLQKQQPGKSYAILEARGATGGTWDLFRYPGIRSDSDLHTFGYEFKPWADEDAIASADKILAYLRETVSENGIDRNIRFHHKVLGANWSSADARWYVDVERARHRRAHHDQRQLAVLRGRLLPLRRGIHPALRGPGVLPWPDRAPAALARRSRLSRQAGRDHRQRRHRGDAGAGDGRRRRARDDAAALADVHHAGAVEGLDRQRAEARCWAPSAATR